jgi:hypothetical protein
MFQTWVINLPLTDAEIEKENSFIFNFPFSDSVAEKMSKKCSMSNDADKSSSGLVTTTIHAVKLSTIIEVKLLSHVCNMGGPITTDSYGNRKISKLCSFIL